MNRHIFNAIVGIVIMLCSINCSPRRERESKGEPVVVDLNEPREKPLDSLVANFKFTALETNDSVIIQDIQKLLIFNEHLYVLDRLSQEILVFSISSGEFTRKIGKVGFGPGEYGRIGDFQVIEGEIVEVLDNMQNKLLKYSIEGEYLGEKKIPFTATSFCYLDNDILFSKAITSGDPEWNYQLIHMGHNLDIVDKYLKMQKHSDLVFGPKRPLQNSYINVNFLPVYDAHIYELNKVGIKQKYFLDFGKKWPKEEILYAKYSQPFDFIDVLRKSGTVYFLNYIEGDNHLILFYEQDGEAKLVIYNKESKESALIKDFDSSLCSSEEYLEYHDGYFVSIKQPYAIQDLYKKGKLPNNIEMNSLIQSMKEMDNPVIVFTKFKN